MILDEKLTFTIKLCGNVIDHEKFGLANEVNSVENFENIIDCIDQRQVCEGVSGLTVNQSNENLLKTFTFTDKIDILRHKKCPLLLPDNSRDNQNRQKTQCCFCKSVKSILSKKIIRSQHNKTSRYLQVKDLSPRKRQKLEALRKKLRNASRSQQKAEARIRLLKSQVKNMQEKMQSVEKDTLEKLLADKSNISASEATAVREIFKAAGVKDPRGRRFSDEWIILCILLHMRSPAAYKFLLENKILPLPCVRTIRR